jgi:hypothetical protein
MKIDDIDREKPSHAHEGKRCDTYIACGSLTYRTVDTLVAVDVCK